MLASLKELLDAVMWLRDLFRGWQAIKDEQWGRDLLSFQQKLLTAKTSEDKKSAAKDLSKLLINL